MTTDRASTPGETDLQKMLDTLEVDVRPGRFTVVCTDQPIPEDEIQAMVVEREGRTLVVPVSTAHAHGIPVEFEASWLTLQVHSSLEAVGLTAALSAALGEVGIACNVLAGFYHDHILVPSDKEGEAVSALHQLRSNE